MNLNAYFSSPGSLTVSALAERIGIKNPAQVRQWQHGYANRLPGPENCVSIEQETGGQVMRWDLRQDDWYRIWPELIGTEGAPVVPADKAPDVERVSGIACELLSPETNWAIVRNTSVPKSRSKVATT